MVELSGIIKKGRTSRPQKKCSLRSFGHRLAYRSALYIEVVQPRCTFLYYSVVSETQSASEFRLRLLTVHFFAKVGAYSMNCSIAKVPRRIQNGLNDTIKFSFLFDNGSSETPCCIVAFRRIGRHLVDSVHRRRSSFSPGSILTARNPWENRYPRKPCLGKLKPAEALPNTSQPYPVSKNPFVLLSWLGKKASIFAPVQQETANARGT